MNRSKKDFKHPPFFLVSDFFVMGVLDFPDCPFALLLLDVVL